MSKIKNILNNIVKRNKNSKRDTNTTQTYSAITTQKNTSNVLLKIILNMYHLWQIYILPFFLEKKFTFIKNLLLLILLSLFVSLTLATLFTNLITKSILAQNLITKDTQKNSNLIKISSLKKAKEIKNNILKRNIFDSTGPAIDDTIAQNIQKIVKSNIDFDNVPCKFDKIPVSLVGVLSIADGKKGFTFFKDPKIEIPDMYKPGEVIIDNEDYEVYSIQAEHVEIRKGDEKICVLIPGINPPETDNGSVSTIKAEPKSETYELTSAEMNDLASDKVITQAGRFVPYIPNGIPSGFQVVGILPGGIFDKLGLQNDDIIVEVNGESLTDPSKGSLFYMALQKESNINFGFLRNGEKMSRKVRIK